MPPSRQAILRYKRLIGAQRDRTAMMLTAVWDDLDGLDDVSVTQFISRTTPALVGAKRAAVALSAGFFALGMGIRPVAVRTDQVPVDPRLRDPFLAAWRAQAVGRSLEEAMAAGRAQAEATAFDFVQSTARRTGDVVADMSGRDVRWQRVPGGSSCPWCVEAANGETYRTAESADFGHDRCDCDVLPA